jgi:SulP family sulfate permease
MTAILVPLVAQFGLQGVFLACLISGVLLVLAGVFRAGEIVSIIPLPVITGFTSGIALVIALGQVGNLTGLVLRRGRRAR